MVVSFFRYLHKIPVPLKILKMLINDFNRISKVYRCGNPYFKFGQILEIKKSFRAFFSGTPKEIFKILGFEIRSFSSTIELL